MDTFKQYQAMKDATTNIINKYIKYKNNGTRTI
jgi:hypothetical protein